VNPVTLNRLIETALEEDLGWGDLSTESVLPTDEVRGRDGNRVPGFPAADVVKTVRRILERSDDR